MTDFPIDKKRIRVVDVPSGATAETAENLLNAVCEDYYVMAIHPGDDGGARAFFNLRTRHLSGEDRPLFRGNKDGKEETALSIIREHVEESCTKLEQRLAEAGIKRSVNWIGKKRLPMRGNQKASAND
jgi:hypothetical protein